MGADPRLQDWINVDMRSAAQGYAKNAQLLPAWQVFCSGLSPLGPSPPERRAPDAAAEHARNGPAVPEARVRPDGADPEAPPRKAARCPQVAERRLVYSVGALQQPVIDSASN